ncbi:carboxymuconolactone decarboxylase family protein [Natrialbaceae archaeon A-CW2]|uniref:Carboxymuconolactone decarboxylase family protein n=1 Tax=Natronosalvus hydrolyticus TaxID=2979988 RepID=A0AAP2Z6G1_9EURY|nr:carboxymuconolactone decarboxylase family protein [Natronosalvus amylolyticus]MCU4751589.1 carboxymuconolactone decarboxylase family protein [Halobacteria archaeon AArc-curdl1]
MADNDASDLPDELPSAAGRIATEYPDLWEQYTDLGKASAEAGPLEGETKRLVKLAQAVGTQSEGAVHSHTRRALEEGIEPEKLKHVALLAVTTQGFPEAVAALTWVEDITE